MGKPPPSMFANGGSSSGSNGTAVWLNRLITAGLIIYTLGFIFFRFEIVMSILAYPQHWKSAILGTVALHFTFAKSTRDRFLLHCASLALLAHILDHHIPNPLPAAVNDESGLYSGLTVVITGANAGLGYETSRRLAVEYGVQVIMGCRSQKKCDEAANSINEEIAASGSVGSVTPRIVDLSDLDSVKIFADHFNNNKQHIDVLFNNAGYIPNSNEPVNKYSLDPAFTSMHLAHFYLTELLLQTNNPELRVVNTASIGHNGCAISYAIFPSFILNSIPSVLNEMLPKPFAIPQIPGCINEEYLQNGIRSSTTGEAYMEAKVANIMHVVELPKHHPGVTAVAVDMGWVGTNILSWMEIGMSPANIGWMRHASTGVVPILHAILSTDEELKETNNNKNVEIVNVFGQTEEAFTKWWWREENSGLGRERMVEMSGRLWEESVKVLKDNGHEV